MSHEQKGEALSHHRPMFCLVLGPWKPDQHSPALDSLIALAHFFDPRKNQLKFPTDCMDSLARELQYRRLDHLPVMGGGKRTGLCAPMSVHAESEPMGAGPAR